VRESPASPRTRITSNMNPKELGGSALSPPPWLEERFDSLTFEGIHVRIPLDVTPVSHVVAATKELLEFSEE